MKYLLAYQVPLFAFLSIFLPGWWSFSAVFYAFGFIPLLELFMPATEENMSKAEEELAKKDPLYDWMLYGNVPFLFAIVICYLMVIGGPGLSSLEVTGKTLSVGFVLGALGINVGHELGHRKKGVNKFLAKCLLLCTQYMHFIIEHNRGHHKRVSTEEDPASAPMGMTLYEFVPRSIILSYISAWNLESERLNKQQLPFFSHHNEMIRFTIIQLSVLVAVGAIFGLPVLGLYMLACLIGISSLEIVNYIEHYGLRREKTSGSSYERVQPHHSWNSNHVYGRLVLYELTRHSDHHYMASRPYQVLRHFDDTPQMPTGYPGMMLLSTIPPIWFAVMNPRAKQIMQQHYPEQHESLMGA
jgi:alkane 1-monooxygenase